jgi:hypothetical protein
MPAFVNTFCKKVQDFSTFGTFSTAFDPKIYHFSTVFSTNGTNVLKRTACSLLAGRPPWAGGQKAGRGRPA